MADPGACYIANGGAVFFALLDGKPAGVVAVRIITAEVSEFCKRVVLESGRRLGLGSLRVNARRAISRASGARLLMLQSFMKLAVALGIYAHMGFVQMQPPPEMAVLKRTEIVMTVELV